MTAPSTDYDITFKVDDAGLMSECGAIARNCAEGCALFGPGSIEIIAHSFG